MDSVFALALLRIYIENSRRILDAGFGVDRAGSAMFDVIELLREEPDLRSKFVGYVEQSLRPGQVAGENSLPPELIELSAHELKWPEFVELAQARAQTIFGHRAEGVGDIASRIIEAFSQAWADREFYSRYKRGRGSQ